MSTTAIQKSATQRTKQVLSRRDNLTEGCPAWHEHNEQYHYLKGCSDTITYLMTGKLPRDGNHDGMKDHSPLYGHVRRDLDALD